MPFNWNPTPNPPTPIVPIPVPPGEVTYEVKLVANTVDYGGTVRYNTANHSYDVVYEFPTLNVTNGVFENGFFESANIGNAHINVATINHASINTANITNATITFGYVTGSPNANMGIASKFYVDNAIAAISGGTGPDSTANLFITKGDLLVGFAPNTAHKLGVGSDGEVLTVFGSDALKAKWGTFTTAQAVSGLNIGTHYHPTLKLSQVLLSHADGFIMNDGEYVGGWDNLVASMTVSGAGGLDVNSVEAPSAWYQVYGIRKSSTGQKNLLLHRMIERTLDQQWLATLTLAGALRNDATALTTLDQRYCTKISQSFVPGRSGLLKAAELQFAKSGTPRGNLWITIQNDNGLGNADGTVLATSQMYNPEFFLTSTLVGHFIFNTAVNVNAGSRYHIVAEGDWPMDDPATGNSVFFYGNTAPLGPGQQSWMANVGYTSGNLTLGSGYGDARCFNVVTGTWKLLANTISFSGPQDLWFKTFIETSDTALALPTGYDQYILLSYVRNNASSNFKEYHQLNQTMVMGFESDWLAWDSGAANALVPVDLSDSVPPVACAVDFTANVNSGTFGLAFGFGFGDRYTTDLQVTPYTDYFHRGNNPFGPNQAREGVTPRVSLDDAQFMYSRQISTGYRLYIHSITF